MCSHFVMLMLIKEATGIAGGAGGCQSSPTPNGKGRQALLFLEATVGIVLFLIAPSKLMYFPEATLQTVAFPKATPQTGPCVSFFRELRCKL